MNTQLQTLNKNNWNLQLFLTWPGISGLRWLWTDFSLDWDDLRLMIDSDQNKQYNWQCCDNNITQISTQRLFYWNLLFTWNLDSGLTFNYWSTPINIQPLEIFPPFKLELCIKTSSKCIKCMYSLYLFNENIFKSSKSWQTFI